VLGLENNPLSPHLRSLQRRPQAPHAKSKFLAIIELAKRDPEAIADLVLMLWDRVVKLEAKVAALERNSRNSSKPPSSDGGNFTNPPQPKSLRG